MPRQQRQQQPALAERVSQAANQTVTQQSGETLTNLLVRMRPEIQKALPSTMPLDRFMRVVMTTVRRQPALQTTDPQSFLAAMMLCAQLGLEPGPLGHAYFVPYGRECTFILGYRGMIDLARRSGEIRSIEARTVYANDEFEFEFGLDPKLRHVPTDGERGDAVKWYGVVHYKDGGHYFEVLNRADVEKYRERSKAKNNGPWKTDFDAMARKTVIRRMSAFLPLTVEAAAAIEADETSRSELPTDLLDLTPAQDAEAEPGDGQVVDVEAQPAEAGSNNATSDEGEKPEPPSQPTLAPEDACPVCGAPADAPDSEHDAEAHRQLAEAEAQA